MCSHVVEKQVGYKYKTNIERILKYSNWSCPTVKSQFL